MQIIKFIGTRKKDRQIYDSSDAHATSLLPAADCLPVAANSMRVYYKRRRFRSHLPEERADSFDQQE